ncbi:hypothetical protein, partial [Staphylococcus aureus]
MIRRPPRSTRKESSAASDVYKRQTLYGLKRLNYQGVATVCGNVAGNSLNANICLLYTSDAADDSLRVDLGGRRIIKKSVDL